MNLPSIRIFCDSADLSSMLRCHQYSFIDGFTTNPSLLRKAGVINYEGFGRMVLRAIPNKPVSFEVFAEDAAGIEQQAKAISRWGANTYVKVTVTDRRGLSLLPTIQALSRAGVALNITALFTLQQIASVLPMLDPAQSAILSIFAGRIADTGRDPVTMVKMAKDLLGDHPKVKLLWASPREIYNLVQAAGAGCDIITLPPELIDKLPTLGKDLDVFARETVEGFYRDAEVCAAGYTDGANPLAIHSPRLETKQLVNSVG